MRRRTLRRPFNPCRGASADAPTRQLYARRCLCLTVHVCHAQSAADPTLQCEEARDLHDIQYFFGKVLINIYFVWIICTSLLLASSRAVSSSKLRFPSFELLC